MAWWSNFRFSSGFSVSWSWFTSYWVASPWQLWLKNLIWFRAGLVLILAACDNAPEMESIVNVCLCFRECPSLCASHAYLRKLSIDSHEDQDRLSPVLRERWSTLKMVRQCCVSQGRAHHQLLQSNVWLFQWSFLVRKWHLVSNRASDWIISPGVCEQSPPSSLGLCSVMQTVPVDCDTVRLALMHYSRNFAILY